MGRAKKSSQLLKGRMENAPILRHFEPTLEVDVNVYANAWAFGATLTQKHDDKFHPVRFIGRVLKDAELQRKRCSRC